MANMEVKNWENKTVTEINLPSDLFEVEVKEHLLHACVRWQQAGYRQGTHAAKTKGLVSGGGKKPFRQKGTGNARQGSTRSPLNPGGGVIFGPTPRSHAFSMPKKQRTQAIKMALSALFKRGKVTVLEEMTSSEGKTKEMALRIKTFGWEKAIFVDQEIQEMFQRAGRNLQGFSIRPPEALNVYDLLKYDNLVITPQAVKKLEERLGRVHA